MWTCKLGHKLLLILSSVLAFTGCNPWGNSKIISFDFSKIISPAAPTPVSPPPVGVSIPWDGKLTVIGSTQSSAANYKFSLYKVSTGVALNPNFNTKEDSHQMAVASYNGADYLFMLNYSLDYNSTTYSSHFLQYIDTANVSATPTSIQLYYAPVNSTNHAKPSATQPALGQELQHWVVGQCSYFAANDAFWVFDLANPGAGAQNLGITFPYSWSVSYAPMNFILVHNGNLYVKNSTNNSIHKIEPAIGCTQNTALGTPADGTSVPFIYNNKVHFFSVSAGTYQLNDEDGNVTVTATAPWTDTTGQQLANTTDFLDYSHLYTANATDAFFITGTTITSINMTTKAFTQYSDTNGNIVGLWGVYNVGGKIIVGAFNSTGRKQLYHLDTTVVGPLSPFNYLTAIETYSYDPVFAKYNLQNPVQLGSNLYFSALGADGIELHKIDGSAPTPAVTMVVNLVNGPGSSNPRMLKLHNGVIYFLADKADGTPAFYKMSSAESFTELPNINAEKFLLHNFTVLAQLPSDITDDLSKCLYSLVDIGGETYINIHGNRAIEISATQNDEVAGQGLGAFSTPTPIVVPYALGISLGGLNYVRGDSVPIGKYQGKDILKLFSTKGYQFYSYDGNELVQLTDMPDGVGQLTEYLAVMLGSKVIFSTLRSHTHSSYISSSGLFMLDLDTQQVTEIKYNGNSIPYAANFRTSVGDDGKSYLYAMALIPAADPIIFRVDTDGNVAVVQTPPISLYNYDWSTFGMVEAYGELYFVSKDSANMVEQYDTNQNLLGSQPELDLWKINMKDSSPNPQATLVVDNMVEALDVEKKIGSDYYKGYPDMFLLNFTATGMLGRKVRPLQIAEQKYLIVPNGGDGDLFYDNLLYVNANGGLDVVATNYKNLIELTDSLVIIKADGTYWEVKNGAMSNLNLNLPPASTGADGTYRNYSGFVGYGNRIYFSVLEATIDTQTQQPATVNMKLKELTLSAEGNHAVREITSLINGVYDPALPASQLVMMNFSLGSTLGKTINISGTKVYTVKTTLPVQVTDLPKYDVVIYDIITDAITTVAIPNISTTDAAGANITLVPASIGFFDQKNVDSLKKRGAFINGIPANGAFIYSAYLRSDVITSGGGFAMSPVLYYFNGSTLEKLYQWNVTQDQVLGFILNPSCFIATAAYGSILDNHIDSLREFRDQFLMKSELGEKFVNYYYANAPQVAHYVAQHNWARATVRGLLWPVVLFSTLSLEYGIATATAVFATAAITLIFGLFMLINARRRLRKQSLSLN